MPGLRERKKQKTREAIQRAAVRLFLKHGYDETTIEDIAAAVDISPSTFFNYFPTKEEVVMLDIYDPIAIAMLREGPKDEPASATFRRALLSLAAILEQDRELILSRARLLMQVPALRARVWDEMERTQDVFASIVAERLGRDPSNFELRVMVRVLIAATYEATLRWLESDGQGDLADLLSRALDAVDAGTRLDALQASTPAARGGRSGRRRRGRRSEP